MASSYAVAIELGEHLAGSDLTEEAFPNLAHAVAKVAAYATERWVEYAEGAPLPDGKRVNPRTGEYARSIHLNKLGAFAHEVASRLPYAKVIEEGAPQYDMKRMLNTSFKVRISKRTGSRYLIIPFRHDRWSKSLPDELRDFMNAKNATTGRSNFSSSHILLRYQRENSIGVHDIRTHQLIRVPGWRYKWGDRVEKDDLRSLGIAEKHHRRLLGMYKFAHPGGGPNEPKKGSHTQFVTFRVMTENAVNKWIAPARPGLWVARTVADQVRPLAEESFRAAVEADARALLGGE